MREQLEQYVNLLFAGAKDCEDIKQEILQNTLDRYDDLIAEGKVPEAAYRLAITGIGDVNEILGIKPQAAPVHHAAPAREAKADNDNPMKKLLRAVAIGLYIISFIPMFILSEMGMSTFGLCGTLCIVAVATVLILLGAKKSPHTGKPEQEEKEFIARQELDRSIGHLVWIIGLSLYFVISFLTNAWYITWLLFPITGAVKGLIKAILDLKGANDYEN